MDIAFNIQLYWLLIPYFAFLALFAIFALINLFHIVKWGGFTFVGFVATFIFLAGVVLISFLTYENLKIVDWSEMIYSFNGFEANVNMGF